MKVPRHILAEAIARKTMKLSDPDLLAREIAAYLIEQRRISELEPILRDILQYRADHGVLEAEVVTAHDVQPHVLAEVEQLLQAAYPHTKQVHVIGRGDSSIIGGLRVDMANEQLDMSVAHKLATFKRLTAGENI